MSPRRERGPPPLLPSVAMSIHWDTLLARHTAAELDRALARVRLRAVRLDRSTRDLTLLFKDRTLIWRLHPSRGHLRLHAPVEPAAGDHRLRATLRRVEAPPDERLIRFDFSEGRTGRISLVVELMGAQWNVVVTEGDAGIVRHLLWRPSGDTRRLVGQPYEAPAGTGRVGIGGDVSLEDWLETLGPLRAEDRPRALVRRFAWTSPINAAALLGAPGKPGAETGLAVGFERWQKMADARIATHSVLLEGDKGGPQPYPFPLAGTPSVDTATLMAAFAACSEAGGEGGDASSATVLGPELLDELEGRLRQSARRVRRLKAELEGVADPSELRRVGDLILARYHEIPGGATVATLTGFDGVPVEIRLESGEPAHAVAARYYQRAAKAERAARRLPGIIERAWADRAALVSLLERVRSGQAHEAEVREALGPARTTERGDAPGSALPYRTFRSSGGLEIRVGRGARFNDDLTFHHSSPADVWLHARHTSGAHVILRWQGEGKPPARDLEEAATLAALHSKARTSGTVPVDWTLRKYVRKPRKSPPGQVNVERAETLFVEPDASLLEALAESRSAT